METLTDRDVEFAIEMFNLTAGGVIFDCTYRSKVVASKIFDGNIVLLTRMTMKGKSGEKEEASQIHVTNRSMSLVYTKPSRTFTYFNTIEKNPCGAKPMYHDPSAEFKEILSLEEKGGAYLIKVLTNGNVEKGIMVGEPKMETA
ncbi:MAG TPA: hypothetical protein VL576_00170 [Candidatus Paceibacterota bacterium]|jgi:hypothetical protein|nr:hypothetical protein [Candidatus Paceibacterota bacterium]